jgi:hypothetical protein
MLEKISSVVMVPVLSFSLLAACSTGHGVDVSASDAGVVGDSSSASDGSAPGDASDASSAACASEIPCTSDVGCVSLPGYACNTALAAPVCQRLRCATSGSCVTSAFCATDSTCRVVDHAQGTQCLPATVTKAECETSCLTAADNSGCTGTLDRTRMCSDVCADLQASCKQDGGLQYVNAIGKCQQLATSWDIDFSLTCQNGKRETRTFTY